MTPPRKPVTDTAPPVPKWWAGHPNPERSRAHRISSWWFVARRTLCGLPLQPEWVRLCPIAREECPTCARIAREG